MVIETSDRNAVFEAHFLRDLVQRGMLDREDILSLAGTMEYDDSVEVDRLLRALEDSNSALPLELMGMISELAEAIHTRN